MFRMHLRFRRRIFVGLAFAALTAPAAAQAQTGFFVDGGPAPVSNVAVSSYQPSYLRYHEVGASVAAGPIARSERSSVAPASTSELSRFLAMERATTQQSQSTAISERSNGVAGPDPSLVPQIALSTSSGFDWSDAGIGASTVLAAALLLGIALFLTRRNQHSGLTSA
jgi:hypothetical protein